MNSWILRRIIFVALLASISVAVSTENAAPRVAWLHQNAASRLAQLVEANVIAVHAYQVLLAKKSGKGDPVCYSPGKLSDRELEALSEHQERLLKSDLGAVKAWVGGAKSNFDSAACSRNSSVFASMCGC